jgi:sugar-specific transcriptional regulator TrmB
MIEKVLQNIGLSEKGIRMYLMMLETGTQPASVLARRMGIPRNTARFILDELSERGFASKTYKANTQLYSPVKPKGLIDQLERQRAKMNLDTEKRIGVVKKAIQELRERYKPKSSKPRVAFYEGKEGVITMYENTLKSSETIRSFGCYDIMRSVFSDYFKSHHARRLKEGIRVRRIHPDTPQGVAKARLDQKELRESRLIPHETYYFTPEILVYDNHVLMISWKELLGIHIESEEVATTFKVIFELAWKEADRIDPRRKRGEPIFTFDEKNN